MVVPATNVEVRPARLRRRSSLCPEALATLMGKLGSITLGDGC